MKTFIPDVSERVIPDLDLDLPVTLRSVGTRHGKTQVYPEKIDEGRLTEEREGKRWRVGSYVRSTVRKIRRNTWTTFYQG